MEYRVPKDGENSAPRSWGPQTHLKEYLRVVARRRWILVTVFLSAVFGASLYLFLTKPIYRATATLLIESSPMNLTDFKQVYESSGSDSEFTRRTFLETQYKLILSRPLIENCFLRFDFGSHQRFREAADPIERFKECFEVTPVRRTRLVEISFDWVDPELAARVVDFQVKQYLDDYRKRRRSASEEGLVTLREKAADLQPKVEERAKDLQRFMKDNNMVSFEKAQDIVVERMKAISRNLTEVERLRIRAEARYEDIARAVEAERPLEEMPEIIQSDTIRDLKLEYIRSKQECSGFQNRFGPNHPEVLAAQARLQGVTEKMQNEVIQVLASAKMDFKREQEQEADLKESLAEQERRVMELNDKSVEYNLRREKYETLNKAYRSVTQRIEEIEISIATEGEEDNIFVISHAKIPTQPVHPKKGLILIAGTLMGLLAGLFLCFFVEYLDTTLKSKEEVERILEIPVMGSVPAADAERKNGAVPAEFHSLENHLSSFAEAFRSLRTALTFSLAGRGVKTLLVTSAAPMEGKTLVGLNTAMALARTGKKVLIVDADMRRPRLTKLLHPEADHGLSALLVGMPDATLESAVVPTAVAGLDFLPCGVIPHNAAELLESAAMGRIVEEMSERYDHILFDTPPVATTTDAAVLGQWVQGAVIVIRTYSTQRELARRARDILVNAQARIVGAVLNNVDAPRFEDEGYGYSDYYEDGAADAGEALSSAENRAEREKEGVC